jgi:hypothetical protein
MEAKSIARSARNGAWLGERELHRVAIRLLDGGQELREAHVVEVVVPAAGYFMIRIVVLPLPLEGEQHVVGVEIPRRLEILIAMPLHAPAEVEGVDLAILRHVPALGQSGLGFGGADPELDQPVVDRQVRIEGRARGVEHRVEVLGRAFRAIDQGLGVQA